MNPVTVESLRLRALHYVRHGGLSPSALAKLTALDESTFRHAMRRKTWKPRPATIDAILAIIPCDWQPPENGDSPVRKAA